MGIFAYGAMVAYLMGIGDNMSLVVAHWGGIDLKQVRDAHVHAVAMAAPFIYKARFDSTRQSTRIH